QLPSYRFQITRLSNSTIAKMIGRRSPPPPPVASGAKARIIRLASDGTTLDRALPVRACAGETRAFARPDSPTPAVPHRPGGRARPPLHEHYAALLGPLPSKVFSEPAFSDPIWTLICFGFASAFLGRVIFRTPFS